MGYKVFIEKLAQKELLNIPKNDQNRIIEAIQALSKNPRPHHVKKLSGREAWRIRVGKYRIIYEIDDGKLTILVILVGHRKEVYRK
jgi:mRNA interferase RelE/StbE